MKDSYQNPDLGLAALLMKVYSGPDKMGEALILPTVQQMRYVARNRCWKPMNFSKREPSTF